MIGASEEEVNGIGTCILLSGSINMVVRHVLWNKNNESQDMVITPIFTKINDENDAIKCLTKEMDGYKKLNVQYSETIDELKKELLKYKPYYDKFNEERIPKKQKGNRKIINKDRGMSCAIVEPFYYDQKVKDIALKFEKYKKETEKCKTELKNLKNEKVLKMHQDMVHIRRQNKKRK